MRRQLLTGLLMTVVMTVLLGVGLVMNVSMRRFYASPSRTTQLLGL